MRRGLTNATAGPGTSQSHSSSGSEVLRASRSNASSGSPVASVEVSWRGEEDKDKQCTVCFEDLIQPLGESHQLCAVPGCLHKFHINCLRPWWQQSEDQWHCPNCRRDFTKILAEGQGLIDIFVTRSRFVDSEEEEESEEEPDVSDPERCQICGNYGLMVICDGCEQNFHPHCAGLSDIPDNQWYCSTCRRSGLHSTSRQRTHDVRQPVDAAQLKKDDEQDAIEAAWRHMDMIVQRASSSTRRNDAPTTKNSSVAFILHSIKSSTGNNRRRLMVLPNFISSMHNNPLIVKELLDKGLLLYLRGWFQVSLDAASKDSLDERHFRSALLHQIDGLKNQVTRDHLAHSRITKILLRCSSEDVSGHNRIFAARLFETFCSISSMDRPESNGTNDNASTTTAPSNIAASNSDRNDVVKRPRVRRG